MNTFISGGCKNGKSFFAQNVAVKTAKGAKLYYVATMIPCDEEDRLRIKRHVAERDGLGFETIECGRNIISCLDYAEKDAVFLLDSVTALLMNEMYPAHSGKADLSAPERCAKELAEFASKVKGAVFVSDYIYSDVALYDDFTQNYRRGLAHIDRSLASVCENVFEVCAGNIVVHKGENLF